MAPPSPPAPGPASSPAPLREVLVTDQGTVRGHRRVLAILPPGLSRYGAAFLATPHDRAGFLWRGPDGWLAVTLTRVPGSGPAQASLRWSAFEMPEGLTSREIDVLTLVCLGLTNQQVALRLGTSARTVSTQVERLLTKLGQTGRAGLAALAVELGLLRLPVPGGVQDESGLVLLDLERAAAAAGAAQPRDQGREQGREQARERGPAVPPAPARSRSLRRPVSRPVPLRIGSVLPLTGPAWADGLERHRGAELAVSQLNAAGGIGGRPVEHVVASADFFDPGRVLSAVRSLVDLEVDAIITSYASADCPEVLELVADFGQPFLHTATFEQQVQLVREDRGRYGMVFQTCPSETHYGVGLVRLLDQLRAAGLWQPRNRRLVSLELDTHSTRTANEQFFAAADASGWQVADVVPVPTTAPDWKALVERSNRHDPAVVIATHYVAESLAAFQRAFSEHGNGALVHGVYGPSIPAFTAQARDAAEGMIWSTVTGTYDDVFGRAFRRDFERMHGTPPGLSQAGAAYDQVRLLSAAWSSVPAGRVREVLGFLRTTVYRGVNGVYYLGDSGQTALSYPDVTPDPSLGQAHTVFQVQDGQSLLLGPAPYGDLSLFRRPPSARPA